MIDVEFRAAPGGALGAGVPRGRGIEKDGGAHGDGPVEAVIEAIKQVTDKPLLRLRDFDLEALSGGADAQAR